MTDRQAAVELTEIAASMSREAAVVNEADLKKIMAIVDRYGVTETLKALIKIFKKKALGQNDQDLVKVWRDNITAIKSVLNRIKEVAPTKPV